MKLRKGEYFATVTSVVQDGPKGAYAFAELHNVKMECVVTFSLQPPCWKEEELPERCDQIVVAKLRKKKKWRANRARFLTPEDESGKSDVWPETRLY